MGIESDQLVFDYLSRVGDLAQQRHVPAAERMRLITELRRDIDRRRARPGGDSPAAVRRTLGRLGSPAEVVAGAGGAAGAPAAPEPPAHTPVPPPRPAEPEAAPEPERPSLRKVFPGARERAAEADPAPPEPRRIPGLEDVGRGVSGPDLAGASPDWWRVESTPEGLGGGGGAGTFGSRLPGQVAGFQGGVEIPELLNPGLRWDKPAPADAAAGGGEARVAGEVEEEAAAEEAVAEPAGAGAGARRRRFSPRALVGGGLGSPLLLLAAALLVAGAVLGNVFCLLFGWATAYLTKRLTPLQAKFAALGIPALTLLGGAVWLWGRTEGRWGEVVPEAGMADAVTDLWPVLLRTAAVASAVYLLWRARRTS
ncbi:hypothetical protein ACIPPN_09375 [Streptomyces diastaticus]|uniref:Integral membrane protein n=2 Tax=Streptomyces TaxID=1883 RepID=A0A380MN20_STRGR|nr:MULTISPECIES: hypothetical protein [Streptomyces]MBL3805218.1 hypothetical protein [Streptomyces sp. BRB081]MDQ0294023.1 hypothetical protein [Streptomyces sp. DSM 41037]SUO93574.1 Integral membrane protein [Streptomyces griseus]GFH64185.1 membrane protein [Streptomyces rutgersensis]GFH69784.1 membrane protein [Streptomyces diastaticus subsp. diastaticus]